MRAPLGSADRLLHEFIAQHPATDAGARLTLHARDLELPAVVTLTPNKRPGDMTPRFRVHWEAASGGLYPVFDGELTIGADEDYDAFWLVLDGGYVPPGGIAGKVFDAVVGNTIAQATANGLLADMRASIEARITTEEANKPRA